MEGFLEDHRSPVDARRHFRHPDGVHTFAISEFLTNNKIKLFGTIIQENINSSMWNYGAALAFVMLIIIGITTLFDKDKEEAEGGLI